MKILMLVMNAFQNDSRVFRAADTLGKQGHTVLLLAMQTGNLPENETHTNFTVKRIGVAGLDYPKPIGKFGLLHKAVRSLRIRFASFRRLFTTWLSLATGSGGQRTSLFRALIRATEKTIVDFRFEGYARFADLCVPIANSFDPDRIHAHDFNTLPAAMRLHTLRGTPFVYDSHELWLERNRAGGLTSAYERMRELEVERMAIRKAAHCITVCDGIADYLQMQYSIPRPVVIRNTPYRLHPTSERKSLRDRLNIAQTSLITCFVGKATFNRGIEDVLFALPHLPKDVVFVVLGYFAPDFRTYFDTLVAQLKIADRVKTFGPVPSKEVSQWLCDVDVAFPTMRRICPSYLFALPNKLFESIQAGLPILGPDSPEITRIIDHYKVGRTYRDGDPEDFAQNLTEMLKSPETLKQYADNAKIAAADLCWENEAHRLIRLYESGKPITS